MWHMTIILSNTNRFVNWIEITLFWKGWKKNQSMQDRVITFFFLTGKLHGYFSPIEKWDDERNNTIKKVWILDWSGPKEYTIQIFSIYRKKLRPINISIEDQRAR